MFPGLFQVSMVGLMEVGRGIVWILLSSEKFPFLAFLCALYIVCTVLACCNLFVLMITY